MVINMRNEKYPHLISGLKDLITNFGDDIIMAEIGSYAGHSTKIFLDNAIIGTLYCVDPWLGGYDDADDASHSDMIEAEKEFDIRIINGYDNVVKIKKSSVESANDFDDEFFDVVYIDGNHTYDAVLSDITAWLPKVKKGGIICGHDYTYMIETKKAVNEFFGRPDKTFADSSWMVAVK